jgi:DNA-binding transcriptional LysR family regulator
VAAGLGLAFVSLLAASDELERGELRAFALPGAGPLERWLVLVRPRHRRPTALAQAFEHTLRAFCDRHMRIADGAHHELALPQLQAR